MAFFVKNIFLIFFFCSIAFIRTVIIHPSEEQQHFNTENTLIMFDVDGVLINRPIAALKNISNIWSVFVHAVKLFLNSTEKVNLIKTIFTMFKDRSLIIEQINKYDLERIITWLKERYPALQQPTRSGNSFYNELKALLTYATPNKDTIDLLKKLHNEGYKIALATNQGKSTVEHFVTLGMLPDFSYYILPYTIDYGIEKGINPPEGFIKKPQKRYYKNFKVALEQTNFHPERFILIDDMQQNLSKAAKKGIIGIHFASAQQTEDDLKNLGIVI